jgi:hypothetical protein
MDLTHIRDFTHKHCRFKLKSGKEVYGVVWEVETSGSQRLYFASVRDYQRLQRDPGQPISIVPMQPDEIVHVQDLAS